MTQEYIAATEKDKIAHLQIDIPSLKGNFWIIEARRLAGYISNNDTFELAIILAYGKKTVNGKILDEKISGSRSLNRFLDISNDKTAIYVLKTDNNIPTMVSTIQSIIEEIFASDDVNNIKTKLWKISDPLGALG